MKKSTRIILIVLASLCGAAAVFGGLMAAGLLPSQLTASIVSSLDRIRRLGSKQTDEDPGQAQTLRVPPGDMHGVWLDMNTDLRTGSGGTYSDLVNEANELFSAYRNVRGDTLFLTPDLTGRFTGLRDAYGTDVDAVWEIFTHADAAGYYKVLVAGESVLLDVSGGFTDAIVSDYLKKYPFDALLIEGDALRAAGKLSGAVGHFGALLAAEFPERSLGVFVASDPAARYADADTVNALSSPYLRFCVTEAGGAMHSTVAFGTVMDWWNTFAAGYPQLRFYCRLRNDLVRSNESDWASYTEINDQVRFLWDCEQFDGNIYYGTEALRRINGASMQRLAYLLYDGADPNLKFTGLAVESEGAGVRFTGSAPAAHKLLCNRQVMSPSGGAFSFALALAEGANSFRFFSAGADQRYRFFRNSQSAAGTRAAASPDPVTPYTDHGLGTALICRVAEPYTETLGSASEKNTYHADFCNLTGETLDYVKSVTASSEGHLRYELESGFAVYAENCELLTGVYRMPENRITVLGVNDAAAAATEIVFSTDWLVPVSVQCLPQSYHAGYRGYSYTIDAFTANYVDVRFFHTASFSGDRLLTFAPNSPFVSASVLQDGDCMILRLNLRRAGQFYGFRLSRNEEGRLVLSFKKHADGSLVGKTVMLDAGHGGAAMTGTALPDDSIAEKDVTISIARKAKQMLESYGAAVLMTRTLDTSLSLQERCDIQYAADPDVFVSIHCDGVENPADNGTHTFYFRPYSMPLASAIHESMVGVYRAYIYQPTDTNYANIDRKIKFYPFFVTRLDGCPSVLVETGFMSNAVEGMILANDNYQYWMAQGIAEGVRNYFAANY